ncbi:hypothetical protein [Microbacterium esteraromaticum]|uniref:hypothetical protein n=1 Tax=Microbacterium esteraromaticum TaxID=57043 RepID=UPI0019D323C3|nr:hypothetical protein [Microbacterium esteraromaticum]MBN7794061.1 hypothetical protein [Microbacterium esteraromaticum]
MSVEASRRRVPAVILWGGLVVLAWAALTVLVGSGDAHADDDDSTPLSGLSSLVTGAVTEVVDPVVEKAAEAVVAVTDPVVESAQQVVTKTAKTVASVPVVGSTASDALGTVSQTVSSTTDAVTDVVSDAPVSSVLRPITDTVREVPVVGEVLDDLGATDLLDDSAGAVDGVVDKLAPVVNGTVPPVVDALDPQHPTGPTPDVGEPALPTGPDAVLPDDTAADATADATPAIALPTNDAHRTPWSGGPNPRASSGDATTTTAAGIEHPKQSSAPPPGLVPASSAAGTGGSAGGGPAAVHLSASHLHDSGVSAGPPADSALPPSPVGDTDVSPD